MFYDGRYKFTRYFSLQQHHTPRTENELFSLNDIELYDLQSDPHEMNNLAKDKQHLPLIMALNHKLNALYATEVAVKDDGSWIPSLHGIQWDIDTERIHRLMRD